MTFRDFLYGIYVRQIKEVEVTLTSINVLQIKEVEVTLTSKDGSERKVIGRRKWRRMNPYHPISYLVIVCALIYALLLFGFVGMWDEIDFKNPFKWK